MITRKKHYFVIKQHFNYSEIQLLNDIKVQDQLKKYLKIILKFLHGEDFVQKEKLLFFALKKLWMQNFISIFCKIINKKLIGYLETIDAFNKIMIPSIQVKLLKHF